MTLSKIHNERENGLCHAHVELETVTAAVCWSPVKSPRIIKTKCTGAGAAVRSGRGERDGRQTFSVPNMAIERCTWD